YGKMARDFTYIDDIVDGIDSLINHVPKNGNNLSNVIHDVSMSAPYQLFNIGFGSPVELMDFIHEIEKNLGLEAEKNMLPMQPGDVPKTWADIQDLKEITGFNPQVSVKNGVKNFIEWYKDYYMVR
ncbi:MAG: GDP-mannose 4,6-dehydratase, partial [Candidatus Paceibacterota bacterium]